MRGSEGATSMSGRDQGERGTAPVRLALGPDGQVGSAPAL